MSGQGSTTRALVWRHPVESFQGAVSLASRLAALNGRPMPNFLREMGIHPNAVDRADPDAVAELARLADADVATLLRDTPRRTDDERFRELAGERLYRLSVQRTFFRFCPRCTMSPWMVSGRTITASMTRS